MAYLRSPPFPDKTMSVLKFSADPAVFGGGYGDTGTEFGGQYGDAGMEFEGSGAEFGSDALDFGGGANVFKNVFNVASKSKEKVLQYEKIFKSKETACLMPYDNSHGKEKYSVVGDLIESLVQDAKGKNKDTMFRSRALGGYGMQKVSWSAVTVKNILDYKEWAYGPSGALGAKDTSKLCFEWGISSQVLNQLSSFASQVGVLGKGGDLRDRFFKLHHDAFIEFAKNANTVMGTKQGMANTHYTLKKYFAVAKSFNETLRTELKEKEDQMKLDQAEKEEDASIDAKHMAEARARAASEKKEKLLSRGGKSKKEEKAEEEEEEPEGEHSDGEE